MDTVTRSKEGITLISNGVKVFIPRAFVADALKAITAKEDKNEGNQT